METDNNVYIKKGRKYIPIGIAMPNYNYLTDGLWLIRHKPHSSQATRADYLAQCYGLLKCGDLKKIDLTKLGDMEKYAEQSATLLSNLPSQPLSYLDIGRLIIQEIVKTSQQE